MKALLWNIVLAVAWAALTGQLRPLNLTIGFVVGAAVIWFVQRENGSPDTFTSCRKVLGLALFFLWELIVSNLRVAYDVVTPRHHMRPGDHGRSAGCQDRSEIRCWPTWSPSRPAP